VRRTMLRSTRQAQLGRNAASRDDGLSEAGSPFEFQALGPYFQAGSVSAQAIELEAVQQFIERCS
jgi:hypothetical protein